MDGGGSKHARTHARTLSVCQCQCQPSLQARAAAAQDRTKPLFPPRSSTQYLAPNYYLPTQSMHRHLSSSLPAAPNTPVHPPQEPHSSATNRLFCPCLGVHRVGIPQRRGQSARHPEAHPPYRRIPYHASRLNSEHPSLTTSASAALTTLSHPACIPVAARHRARTHCSYTLPPSPAAFAFLRCPVPTGRRVWMLLQRRALFVITSVSAFWHPLLPRTLPHGHSHCACPR
jgi:hypothetical protein